MEPRYLNLDVDNERHSTINKVLERHDIELSRHRKRLDTLEQHRSKVEVQIQNLIEKIEDLIWLMKWFLLGLLASGGSFILWYIKEVIS